jgi:hypothetical protein
MTPILQLRRREAIVLWISWATATWAGFSIYQYKYPLRVPLVLSGAIALLGGFVGVVYLFNCTRTWRSIALGVISTACNFGYVWWYAYEIAHQ